MTDSQKLKAAALFLALAAVLAWLLTAGCAAAAWGGESLADIRGIEGAQYVAQYDPGEPAAPRYTRAERWYRWGAVGDLLSTAIALERCPYVSERNPLVRAAGLEDTATIVASGVIVKWAVWRLLHRLERPDLALGILGVGQTVATANNLHVLATCPQGPTFVYVSCPVGGCG